MTAQTVEVAPLCSHDERAVMSRYARGEEIAQIVVATRYPHTKVVDLITNVAKFDRGRARAAVLAYDAAVSTPQGRRQSETAVSHPVPKAAPTKRESRMSATAPEAVAAPPVPHSPTAAPDDLEQLLTDAETSNVTKAIRLAARIRELLHDLGAVMQDTKKERELLNRRAELRKELDATDAALRSLKDKRADKKPEVEQPKSDTALPAEVRTWARENSVRCPDKGRIPKDVQAKYDAAHASGTP